jgi:hypothetical protein
MFRFIYDSAYILFILFIIININFYYLVFLSAYLFLNQQKGNNTFGVNFLNKETYFENNLNECH